jgi:pantetheine-phosphate adenylyltransferase
MHKRGIYAGTFDPFTNGHQDILDRSLKIFDEVTILVAVSPTKKPMFSVEQRLQMLHTEFSNEKKIKVDSWDGLVVDYARQHNIGTLIRGLRPTGDFEIEFQMAAMNHTIFDEIETVFFMTEGLNYFISSSLIREIHQHGGDVTPFVPDSVFNAMKKLRKS